MKKNRSHLEMGNDNCGCFAGWPKAKKSKTEDSETVQTTSNWAYLPTVILHDIFSLLTEKDRINASSACRMWRPALYHPSFCQDVTFAIEPLQVPKARYFISTFGHIVRNATIRFDSLSPRCVLEFLTLLQLLSNNTNLKSLMIEPTHCRIEQSKTFILDMLNDSISMRVQMCCQSSLERFSIGGCEELCETVPEFLKMFGSARPEKVTLLGLASVKDDPSNYLICECSPTLFMPFRNLKVLSIDYDILSDTFLEALEPSRDLRRLVVHIHGVWAEHPGTTEHAWVKFKETHPDCQLRMTFIHAYDEVAHMQDYILKVNMPLSHLKVFFCEYINVEVLNLLSTWYPQTLRSIVWVDSQCHDSQTASWNLVRRLAGPEANQPDPLVMAAWLCSKLEEIVLLGYKYFEEDLVAIARLRNDTLKVLEVANDDVIFSNEVYRGLTDSKEEVSHIIGKPWAPLKKSELHPVICDPTTGDSDEYLLPKVLADLY